MTTSAQELTDVIARRVQEIRGARKLSAQRLAEAAGAVGLESLGRWVIANLETGRRESVSVDELLALAVVLNVSPVNLLLPSDETEYVSVTPEIKEPAFAVREWIYGQHPLREDDDEQGYMQFAPPAEQQQRWAAEQPAVRAAAYLLELVRGAVTKEYRGASTDATLQRLERQYETLGQYIDLLKREIEDDG